MSHVLYLNFHALTIYILSTHQDVLLIYVEALSICLRRYHWIHEGCSGCIYDPDEGPFCRQNRTFCEGSGNPPSGCDGHYCDECQVKLEGLCPHKPGTTPDPNTCNACVREHARVSSGLADGLAVLSGTVQTNKMCFVSGFS